MHRSLLFLLVALLATATAVAQPSDAPDVDESLENATAADRTLEGILDTVDGAVEGIGDAAEATGDGLQDGAAAIGRLLGQAVAAVAEATAAAFRGLATAGAVTAVGLGGAVVFIGEGLGTALVGTGDGLTAGLAYAGSGVGAAFAAIGSGLALIGKAYASLVGSLRPDTVPPVAYASVVGAGAAATTGVGGWAGWQVLKKWGLVGSGLAPMAGFSRIDDDQLLEHPVRSQVFETIQNHPGIHASQLARDVGVGWGTISHHLDKLERARLVAARKVNNQKCYFEQGGAVSRQDMEVASAVKGDTAGRIAAFVHHHPMSSQKVLAEALGISPALASFHTKKLVNLGVLEKMRHGKETLLTTSGAMRRLLESDRDLLAAMDARAEEALQYSA